MIRSKLKTIKRLATLYSMMEEMHSEELQRTMTAVRETQLAIHVEERVFYSACEKGREALMAGDPLEWMMIETQQETTLWRRKCLEEIRLAREEMNEIARQEYVASRLKRDQMRRVLEGITNRIELEEARRIQVVSDDGFLARKRWRDAQGNRQIKSS